jgi:hypothetical protein
MPRQIRHCDAAIPQAAALVLALAAQMEPFARNAPA